MRTVGSSDPGIIPQIQGRVFIIPDLTPLLQSDKGHQDEVFGQFRDIYDGKGAKHFNNGVQRRYDGIMFSCITCVTDVIRKFGRSDLGERFLMAEINANWDENGNFHPEKLATEHEGNAYHSVFGSMASGFEAADELPTLDSLGPERAKCWGLINHLYEWMSSESDNLAACARAIQQDMSFKAEVEALAIWMEHARCPIPPKTEDANVRIRPALPHRSIKQLAKKAMELCIVSKSIGLTPNIRRLVRKIAFDTCHSFSLEIMNWLATHPCFPKEQLATKMNLSPTWVARICHHLQSIGVVEQSFQSNESGRRGANMLCYDLTPEFRAVADILNLRPITTTPTASVAASRYLADLIGKTSGPSRLPSTNGHTSNGVSPSQPLLNGLSFLQRLKRKGT